MSPGGSMSALRALAVAVIAFGAVAGARADGSGSGSGSAIVIPITPDLAAPEVKAVASPSRVELGQHFQLFVTATYGDGVEVNLAEPVALGASFEVARRVSHDSRGADGKHVREWQLDVIAWDVGDLEVPPIEVTFTIGGRAGQVATAPVPVKVIGLIGDTDDAKLLRPDLPPVALGAHGWLWQVVTGYPLVIPLAVALLLAAWMVLRARRRRRRHLRALVAGIAGAPARLDMTTERALERLLALERSGVLDRDAERKAGYAEMVTIVRELLAERHRLATADLTTSELLAALAAVASDAERDALATWLAACDLVKYGGSRASAQDAAAALAGARALIVAAGGDREAA